MDRWVKPEEFVELSDEAEALGFAGVMAGPLVRSSYRAGRLWAQAMQRRGADDPRRRWPTWPSRARARQEAASLLAQRAGLSRTRLLTRILSGMAREDRATQQAAKAAAKAEAKATKKPGGSPRSGRSTRAARAIDPAITWWMLGVAVLVIGVVTGDRRAARPLALLPDRQPPDGACSRPLIVMGRRAERAAYRQLRGPARCRRRGAVGPAPRLVLRQGAGRRRGDPAR